MAPLFSEANLQIDNVGDKTLLVVDQVTRPVNAIDCSQSQAGVRIVTVPSPGVQWYRDPDLRGLLPLCGSGTRATRSRVKLPRLQKCRAVP